MMGVPDGVASTRQYGRPTLVPVMEPSRRTSSAAPPGRRHGSGAEPHPIGGNEGSHGLEGFLDEPQDISATAGAALEAEIQEIFLTSNRPSHLLGSAGRELAFSRSTPPLRLPRLPPPPIPSPVLTHRAQQRNHEPYRAEVSDPVALSSGLSPDRAEGRATVDRAVNPTSGPAGNGAPGESAHYRKCLSVTLLVKEALSGPGVNHPVHPPTEAILIPGIVHYSLTFPCKS